MTEFNGAYGGSSDWAKETLDYYVPDGSRRVENADELRAAIEGAGDTVERFKQRDAYTLALNSGNYPWMTEL